MLKIDFLKEREAFEKAIENDSELQKEVDIYSDLFQGVKYKGLKTELKKLHHSMEQEGAFQPPQKKNCDPNPLFHQTLAA